METNVNYTVVGIFVTVLVTVIVVASLWLTTGLGTENYKIYLIYMNESVTGLTIDAPVKYNGVNVGTVQNISLNLMNPQQVVIKVQIQPDIPITETTSAVLMEQRITGIAYVGLTTGEPAPKLKAKPGQQYPVIPARPSFFVKMDTTVESLTRNAETVSKHVQTLLSQKNIQALQQSLENLAKISGAMAANSQEISDTLKNLDILMKNTADASRQFPDVLAAINRGSTSIQKLTEELTVTSSMANNALEQSKITMESFSNDILPQTYQAVKNINQAAQSFTGLSNELKGNPAMLLHGKAAQRPGPGE